MSAEQPQKLPAIHPFLRIVRSTTFLVAVYGICALVAIEILAAGWKLIPELADQFLTVRRSAQIALTSVPAISSTSRTSSSEEITSFQLTLRRAAMLEASGNTAEARTLLKNLQALPHLPPNLQTVVQRRLLSLSSPATLPNQLNATNLGVRNDVGLQQGSTLGIIECKLMEGKSTGCILRVAMKARPGSAIDVQNIKIHVYFYEKTSDSEVVLTDSPVRSEWLSAPTDWSNGNPQLLDVLYSGPQVSTTPNTFYGYVVGIYYNDELQDSRAAPGHLFQDFPPPMFLSAEDQK